MRLGFHAYLYVERWTDETIYLIPRCRELGGQCVELSVGDDVVFTPRLTRRTAEAHGVDLIVSPGGLWPFECDLSADDPADRARGLAWHKRQVDAGAEVGAIAYTGALYGHPGTVKRRRMPADELGWTAEGLHMLAEHGAQRGIRIVLEPMSRFRTHLANTPQRIMELIALADHPNLDVLVDTFHIITEVRDFAMAIRMAGPRLWGLHACENDRGVPGGGLVPWDSVFSALGGLDFQGYMILETYNTGLDDFAIRRGVFQDICPDGDAFVRQGFAFLSASMARTRANATER
jgi:D-psicose/D-tagatose/L-ribulose 3-epimerase